MVDEYWIAKDLKTGELFPVQLLYGEDNKLQYILYIGDECFINPDDFPRFNNQLIQKLDLDELVYKAGR